MKDSQIQFLLGASIGAAAATAVVLSLARRSQTAESTNPDVHREDIKNGIEECIGNTPLIRIKCLSEATGCEILGKAEVREKPHLQSID